jgi:hypothetical protein
MMNPVRNENLNSIALCQRSELIYVAEKLGNAAPPTRLDMLILPLLPRVPEF